MANTWLQHVKDTMKENKDLKFKEVLKIASKTWKKPASAVKSVKSVKKARKVTNRRRRGRTNRRRGRTNRRRRR
tara:strand:+ start:971 stop:1192 length:222 start_codon:yes stop_codon:yes gene_type:complete